MLKKILFFTCLFYGNFAIARQEAKITFDVSKAQTRINKNIYGHFSEHLGTCIYGGIYVGEYSKIPTIRGMRKDVIEAFKHINMPVLRWPGGCFADEYHWKDGIGDKKQRPSMINTNWGGVTENNCFGTHEFLDFCQLVGCEPYLSGNLGSGTVQEMAQWVEYINSDNVSPMTDLRKKNGREKSWGVKYWGIGNESWGCGGNMTAEYYVNEARKYNTFCRDYGKNRLFRIAVGPNEADYYWTEVVMRDMKGQIQGLSLHYYTWGEGETAVGFTEKHWFSTMRKAQYMDELIVKHSAIMDKYDPSKGVALVFDEWGTWFAVEPGTNPGFLYQQSTLRDALVAGMGLNILNNHADRVRMANIAQVANVLQAIVLTRDEKMILTPTYHIFDMYKVHQNALLVPSVVESPQYVYNGTGIPAVNTSASIDVNGKLHISICNIDPNQSNKVNCNINGYKIENLTGKIVTGSAMNVHNTFEQPNNIEINTFNDITVINNNIIVEIPAMSVVMLEVSGENESLKAHSGPEFERTLKPGIRASLYEGSWDLLPDFSTLNASKTEILDAIKFLDNAPGYNFAMVWDGFIKIENDGFYDFIMKNDDGGRLIINDEIILNNDGLHGATEVSSPVMLSKGYHKIRIEYFQKMGGLFFEFKWQPSGAEIQEIPKNILFHKLQ